MPTRVFADGVLAWRQPMFWTTAGTATSRPSWPEMRTMSSPSAPPPAETTTSFLAHGAREPAMCVIVLGSNGFVDGGDDVMRATSGGKLGCSGDVQGLDSTANNTTVLGGNDRIIGGDLDDRAAGEVLVKQSPTRHSDHHRRRRRHDWRRRTTTCSGGGRLLARGCHGRQRRLSIGGDGNDQLFGQTGNDTLKSEMPEDDRLTGGSGRGRLMASGAMARTSCWAAETTTA